MHGPTIRIGIDGTRLGETIGDSFAALQVEPGAHHLCVNWQSHSKKLSHREVYLQPLSATEGLTYFFRVHVSWGGGAEARVPFSLTLEPVNADEANMLLELAPRSTLKK